jgi:soluble lytic murein transglycosylase
VPDLHLVLDDPRVAAARERERAKDWSPAARAFDDAKQRASLGPDESCAWSYVSGRLHAAANEHAEAAAAFDGVTCAPLGAYGALRGAQALVRAGRADAALVRLRTVPEGFALEEEAKNARAEALGATGDRASALALWRAALAANPHGYRWVDTCVRVANALVDGVGADGGADAAPRAREALELATRVVVEAPKLAEPVGANAARARAIAWLRAVRQEKDPPVSEALSEADRVRLAQAWLDAAEPARAIAEANGVLAAAAKPGPIACKAAIVRAQATGKTRGAPTADAWGDAIGACAGEDALVNALYAGGKASAAAKRPQEALDRFASVEKRFPGHRLADDARFHSALLVLDQGDPARCDAMLCSLPDDYPDGDMRGEALFRAALARMTKGDWAGAKDPLDRILAIESSDRHWATAARAAYFRARADAQTGDAEGARARYVQIVQGHPLAFYMTQAYARLAAEDAALASRTLDEAVARDSEGSFPVDTHPELATPAFERGCRLLEVGELDAAKRELAASGALSESADAELIWVIGVLYNRAGAPELGHAFSRSRVTDHLAHYPAGRWRVPWETAFPRAFEPLVLRESGQNGIPAALTWAIMREESSFWPEAKSPSNAYGLMQLIVPTAAGVAKGTPYGHDEASLKKPDTSIALGAKLLAGLRKAYPANPSLAIAAYNGGGGAVNRWVAARPADDFDLWVEQIPFDETRGYIKRVLASEAAYAFLYDRAALPEVLAIPPRVSR